MEVHNKALRDKLKWRARKGNHEADGVDDEILMTITPNQVNLWMEHGDLITDKQKETYIPYRHKKHGATPAKLAQTEFFDKLDWLKTKRPLPKGFIEKVHENMLKLKADVFVCGHFHVEAQRYYYYKGKVIIILPAHQLNHVMIPKLKDHVVV